ncbi:hypothetical protein C8F04DRAFT_1398695 [Mycena alexandri]|uniref:Uncharacterized protein n=1 Tax=Mycena alexandri TaxID=1745969 RepID=A0AAD6SM65_9AGAR|nr:hypothetical protein C8F04DRAFT_1398695 [Mycena alexandri]
MTIHCQPHKLVHHLSDLFFPLLFVIVLLILFPHLIRWLLPQVRLLLGIAMPVLLGRRTFRSGKEFSQFDLATPPHAVPISAPNLDVTDKLASCITSQEATGQLDELEELEATFSMTTISPPSSSSSPSSCSLFTPPFWVNTTPDYTAPSPFYPASAPSTSSNDSGTNYKKQGIIVPHPGVGNLSRGWPAITALGWFDPDLGGHLTLWDLKLEKHFSFVQYTAGGLFRWICNGFKTDEEFENTGTREEKMERTKEAKTRWEKGVAMYSTVDSLKSGPSVPSI